MGLAEAQVDGEKFSICRGDRARDRELGGLRLRGMPLDAANPAPFSKAEWTTADVSDNGRHS